MDDFITIGTQMKIERPGKACAITPCDDSEGPWVILEDGRFLRLDDIKSFSTIASDVRCVWDNGELVIGYGEFMENNKTLVPAGYGFDWWASDLIEEINSKEAVTEFCDIMNIEKTDCPAGIPGADKTNIENNEIQFQSRRKWHRFLTKLTPNWSQAKQVSPVSYTHLTLPTIRSV